MGPVDYSDVIRSTPLSDDTDDGEAPGFETLIIGWIMLVVSFPIIVFMGLFAWHNISPIVTASIIGLGLWACVYYGTNDSLVARFRCRTTRRRRVTIERRLSGD